MTRWSCRSSSRTSTAVHLVVGGSEHHRFMHDAAQEAFRLTAELNATYRTPEQVRDIISRLTGTVVDESVTVFPPFHSEFGKNLHLGKDVFINLGCRFQDTGGITIGDGTLIGHGSTLTTLNHAIDPARRADMRPAPVVIGRNVWLGAGVTVVPGSPSATAPSSARVPSSPRTSQPTPSWRVSRRGSSARPATTRHPRRDRADSGGQSAMSTTRRGGSVSVKTRNGRSSPSTPAKTWV